MLVVDENFSCLSRAWCMFEVFCTAYAYGSMGMRLALPGTAGGEQGLERECEQLCS